MAWKSIFETNLNQSKQIKQQWKQGKHENNNGLDEIEVHLEYSKFLWHFDTLIYYVKIIQCWYVGYKNIIVLLVLINEIQTFDVMYKSSM